MHDLEFDHLHYIPDDAVNEVAWATDNVELITVGIDIGSSTSHLMFSRVHLQRLGSALSSRFVVISRKVLWQSPILLTPYLPDYTIDTDLLAEFFGSCYHYAGIDPDDIDSGAVILTGEAIKRHNARAIAELFSEVSGKFVCASAGHHMECQMAAHGSGAVAMSKARGETVLNDRGTGTGDCKRPRPDAVPRAAVAGGRASKDDRTHGPPDRANDRSQAAGRAVPQAPGHRSVAGPVRQQAAQRTDLLRGCRRVPLQAREPHLRRPRL
jgi:ethanolamine utilization protein EutA